MGQVIDGRYEIIELLWSGATAQVCRVRHRVLGRCFALKTLRAERSRNPAAVERLLREARALASLNHPNIIAALDSGWLPSGEPYFIMEYAEGVALDRWLQQGPIDPDLALEIASSICEALEAAHRLGIVHRDLKPENVWVDRRGGVCSVKVLDFGLAQVSGQLRLTHPSTTHGTPEYMSPEQASGAALDGRSDLYALGVMLYEMLCGRLPFEAESTVGLIQQHRYAPVPPFERWLPATSSAFRLEPIVARCLEKAPQARFESAAQLWRALAPFRARRQTLRLLSGPPRLGFVPAAFGLGPPASSLHEAAPKRRLKHAALLLWILVGSCLGGLLYALYLWGAVFAGQNL
ncbi:MAG TPA: serine/threonine-protein kinase [Polyangiaceae bacterium]|nr:serine/threonine-protein kinase [Polyangiaceae bacterium]